MSGSITRGDLEIVFYEHHTGEDMENRVLISVAGGRADSNLTLQEFCELLAECRTKIRTLHWNSRAEEVRPE